MRKFLLAMMAGVSLLLAGVAASVPGTQFVDTQGNPVSLDRYIGQGEWVIVKMWSTTCTICKANAHHMVDFQDKYGGKGARVIGIAVDGKLNPDAAMAYIQRHNPNFLNVMDDASGAAAFFQHYLGEQWIGGTPTYLLFDPAGEVKAMNYGPVRLEPLEKTIKRYGGTIG